MNANTPVTETEIEAFRAALEAFFISHAKSSFPDNAAMHAVGAELEHGRKFIRVVRAEYRNVDGQQVKTSGSAYAFIEVATGNIFKPASYKAPAKHARGNIRVADIFGQGKVCGPYSVIYLR